jgi:hypothetical protein
VTAILSPVTLADVERYVGRALDLYVTQAGVVTYLDAVGRHLEAAAGRALHGAAWSSEVAREKRQVYADAVAEWEASPDSSTRHALNAASVEAGHACAGCGLIPAACASGHRYGCHPK